VVEGGIAINVGSQWVGVDLIVPDISLMVSHERCLAKQMRSIQLLGRPNQEPSIAECEPKHPKMYRRVYVIYCFWS